MKTALLLCAALSLTTSSRAESRPPDVFTSRCDAACMEAADLAMDMQAQLQLDIRDYRNALLMLDAAGTRAEIKDSILAEMAAMREAFLSLSQSAPLNASPWSDPVSDGLAGLFGLSGLSNVTTAEFWTALKHRGYDGPMDAKSLSQYLSAHPELQAVVAGSLNGRQAGYDGPFGGLDYTGYVCFSQGHCDAQGRPLGPMTGHDLTEHSDGNPNYSRPGSSRLGSGRLATVPSAGHAASQ